MTNNTNLCLNKPAKYRLKYESLFYKSLYFLCRHKHTKVYIGIPVHAVPFTLPKMPYFQFIKAVTMKLTKITLKITD